MDWLAAPDLWPARWLFTRSLGAVYTIAFVNVALQFRGLLGSHGLTPVSRYVELVGFRQ